MSQLDALAFVLTSARDGELAAVVYSDEPLHYGLTIWFAERELGGIERQPDHPDGHDCLVAPRLATNLSAPMTGSRFRSSAGGDAAAVSVLTDQMVPTIGGAGWRDGTKSATTPPTHPPGESDSA